MNSRNLSETALQVKKEIKVVLLEKNMSQVELAEKIEEGVVQVNRAIAGDVSPKSVKIREKIYRTLEIM